MLSLRKDVKLGLVIGAIVLSVVGVYLILNAMAGGPKPVAAAEITPPANGATPQVDPQTAPRTNTPRNDRRGGPTPQPHPADAGHGDPNVNEPADPNPPGRPNDMWANYNLSPTRTNMTGGQPHGTETPSGTETPGNSSPQGPIVIGAGTPTHGPDIVAEPTAATGPQTYEIEAGDTFSSIATRFYGDARHFDKIIQANPTVNPNKLKPGTKITIPVLEASAKRPHDDTPDVAGEQIDATKQYIVEPGDNLNKIAGKLYGNAQKWEAIFKANTKLLKDDPTKLKPGMVLTLPEPPTHH